MTRTGQKKHHTPAENGGRMAIAQEIKRGIQRVVDRYGSQNAMALALGFKQLSVSRFFRGSNTGYLDICEWLDKLDVRLIWPDQESATDRPVSFLPPEKAAPAEGQVPAGAYRAIPLVNFQTASMPGLIPEGKIDGWHLVWRSTPSLLDRVNLVCCRAESDSQAMPPTLTGGDIVVIDRDDTRATGERRGNIFLIHDKYDGICIRRVRVEERGRETLIIINSDNDSSPPYSIDASSDFGKEISKVIIGRVVYSWSDMSKK